MHSCETLKTILAQASDAALIVDESGTVVLANHQACRMLGYAAGELHGQMVELLMPERFRLAHIGHRLRFTDDRRARLMGASLDLFALCKDGSERLVNLSLYPVRHGLGILTVVRIQMSESDFRTPSAE